MSGNGAASWGHHEQRAHEIRFVTYLSPSIPQTFFETLADHLQEFLGLRVSLRAETRVSGPRRGYECSAFGGDVDLAFMCAPSFVWLRRLRPPPAELLGVAPVFEDERNAGRPVYFCDVIVREDAPIQTFFDLQGSSWAYNDESSLSGYYGLLDKLARSGRDENFFGSVICSGSHLNSIRAVLQNKVHAAAIDSNVLRLKLRETPDLRRRLRVLESWGPYPIQPIVVNSNLHPHLKERLRASFFATNENERVRRVLQRFGLSRFVAVDRENYDLNAYQNLATLLANPTT